MVKTNPLSEGYLPMCSPSISARKRGRVSVRGRPVLVGPVTSRPPISIIDSTTSTVPARRLSRAQAESAELAGPHAGVGGCVDEAGEPGVDGVGQRGDLLGGEEVHLLPLPFLGEPDPDARGAADEPVGHRLGKHLAGREVDALDRGGCQPRFHEVGHESADVGRSDGGHAHGPEGGDDVLAEPPLDVAERLGPDVGFGGQPLGGVFLEADLAEPGLGPLTFELGVSIPTRKRSASTRRAKVLTRS